MLLLKAKWALSTDYVVSLDGTRAILIHDTSGTEEGLFEWEGRKYRLTHDLMAQAGRVKVDEDSPWGILRALLKALPQMLFRQVMYRGIYALTEESGGRVARAEGQGRGIFLIDIGDRVLTLTWSPGENRFRLEQGGELVGWIRQPKGIYRGVEAELPRELSVPVQVFLAMRALERWEFLARGRGD